MLDGPPPRYLTPWTRFYFRSTALGFQWQPHEQDCWHCASELTVKLDLPLRADRPCDPYQAVICLDCGDTVSFFRGQVEDTGIVVAGSAWNDCDPSLSLLRRAIHERAADPPEEWSFE